MKVDPEALTIVNATIATKETIVRDSAYIAGLRAGYNLGVDGNLEKLSAIIEPLEQRIEYHVEARSR